MKAGTHSNKKLRERCHDLLAQENADMYRKNYELGQMDMLARVIYCLRFYKGWNKQIDDFVKELAAVSSKFMDERYGHTMVEHIVNDLRASGYETYGMFDEIIKVERENYDEATKKENAVRQKHPLTAAKKAEMRLDSAKIEAIKKYVGQMPTGK